MLQDVLIGGYIPGDSIIHNMDPRAKLWCSLFVFAGLLFSTSMEGLAATFVFIALAVWMTDTGLKSWVAAIRRFALMLVITFALNLFFVAEGTAVTVGGATLPFTEIGLNKAVLFTGRIIGAICVSILITATTTPYRLAGGISRMVRPLKRLGLPSEHLGTVVALAIRFIPLLQLEVRLIVEAQQSRGIDFSSGNIVTRCRKLSSILVPALTAALARSEILATAMAVRGFHPAKPRSEFRPLKLAAADYSAVGITLLFFAMTLYLK